jgi:hypothetical protein
MSAKRGKLRNVSGSSVNSAQGISVNALFFAPEIGILPFSALPPRTIILSIAAYLAGIGCGAT